MHKEILIQGFTNGFQLGFQGTPNSDPNVKNLNSAFLHCSYVDKHIHKELDLGRFLGPFIVPPFDSFQINPLGLVEKKRKK